MTNYISRREGERIRHRRRAGRGSIPVPAGGQGQDNDRPVRITIHSPRCMTSGGIGNPGTVYLLPQRRTVGRKRLSSRNRYIVPGFRDEPSRTSAAQGSAAAVAKERSRSYRPPAPTADCNLCSNVSSQHKVAPSQNVVVGRVENPTHNRFPLHPHPILHTCPQIRTTFVRHRKTRRRIEPRRSPCSADSAGQPAYRFARTARWPATACYRRNTGSGRRIIHAKSR